MESETELEQRICERAFELWIEEGQPLGRDQEHWDMARRSIAEEDGQAAALTPVFPPEAYLVEGERVPEDVR